MADNIALITYKGGTVSPLDDAIIQQTVISTNGIFKGCSVTNPRGNVLQISSGFGMMKGRFFEVYDCEIGVVLNSAASTLQGRIYIHMDLSNTDEPIQILTETADVLTDLDGDEDVNYNNTFYNMELARFGVTQTGITDLVPTFQKIIGASGSGGSTLKRSKNYEKGDFAYCDSTLGWVTLYCTTAGKTAETEPAEYGGITKIGDTVQDGTCVFTARDVIGELDALKKQEENPPATVGTVRFLPSGEVDDTWLRCDGSYISETMYPELVATLGKSVPNGEKFTLISDGEIPAQISNGVVYAGRMWVYSYLAGKLYGVDLKGSSPIKVVAVTSTSPNFKDFIAPSITKPIALSIVPHPTGNKAKLFLAQIRTPGNDEKIPNQYSWVDKFLIYSTEFSGEETTLTMEVPFSTIKKQQSEDRYSYYYPKFDPSRYVPYVVSQMVSGVETYSCAMGNGHNGSQDAFQAALSWTDKGGEAVLVKTFRYYTTSSFAYQRLAYSKKNKKEIVFIDSYQEGYIINSIPAGFFDSPRRNGRFGALEREDFCPLTVAGEKNILSSFDTNIFPYAYRTQEKTGATKPNLPLPSAAKVFMDAGVYLYNKEIFLIFVGTGIVFSKTLENGSFGYLDTTSTMGVISQYGYLDYSEDEQYLYIMGQDSTGKVKVAKLLLNTQFDYATDGAWLPFVTGDGVPAYIKAKSDKK